MSRNLYSTYSNSSYFCIGPRSTRQSFIGYPTYSHLSTHLNMTIASHFFYTCGITCFKIRFISLIYFLRSDSFSKSQNRKIPGIQSNRRSVVISPLIHGPSSSQLQNSIISVISLNVFLNFISHSSPAFTKFAALSPVFKNTLHPFTRNP